MRVGEREGSLIRFDEHLAIIDEMAGVMRAAMSSLPARAGGTDLAVRRRIEVAVQDTLQQISDAAGKRAAERAEAAVA